MFPGELRALIELPGVYSVRSPTRNVRRWVGTMVGGPGFMYQRREMGTSEALAYADTPGG